MFKPLPKIPRIPRPPLDLLFTVAALLLSLAAGSAILQAPTGRDSWADILFLGSVTLFLLGVVRFLVRALDIEDELDDLPTAVESVRHESDPAGK